VSSSSSTLGGEAHLLVVCFGGFLPYVHGLHFLFIPPRVIIGHQAMASTVLSEYYCLSVCLLFASGMKRVKEHVEEAVGKSALA
jgi:hypothetical protein